MSWPRPRRAPWWFTVLLVLVAAGAAFMFPMAARVLDSAMWLGSDYMGWLYPAYVVAMAMLAWICYPQRRTIAWVLFGVLLLSAIGLFIATLSQQPT